MINIIIFSRDRACQLELFLRSMKHYFREFSSHKINVLYTYSNEKYKVGYEKLFKIHNDSNINYIKEVTKFRDHVLSLIDQSKEYTVFFVDDIVFKNEFSTTSKPFRYFVDDKILCISLRLHPNLSYCYPAQIHMTPPLFEDNMTFKWRGQSGDYGYPMSLDGHIFKTKDIYPLLILPYNNPNSMESILSVYPLNKPKMICFDESIIMNLPINRVQIYNNNVHGNVSASFLNDQFLNDYIIDFEKFKGFKNISCHQEVEINFIKNNSEEDVTQF